MHDAHKPELSIVIPALNEERRLPGTLNAITCFFDTSENTVEVIVVDDGSTDNTNQVVEEWPEHHRVVMKIASHATNRGKGAAIRTGFGMSRGQRILLCDADLSTPIEEVDILREVCDELTVAIGSRALNRDLIEIRQPRHRDLMGRAFNAIQQLLALPGIVDTQCGFKLFPGDLGRALARVQRIDGFAYDVELLLIARRWGYTIQEVPVRWRHVDASRVSPLRHSLQMLRDLIRMAFWRLSGDIPPQPDEGNPDI